MDKVFQLLAGQLTSVFAKSGYPTELAVINLSATETIYLTDQQSTAPGTGTPLGPGNVGSWAGRKALYASPGAGVAAGLAVSDSLNSLFPAGAVAQQLFELGLTPEAIGNQIALQGAPPINAFNQIYRLLNLAWTGVPVFVPAFDVSKYNALEILISLNTATVPAAPTLRSAELVWFADAGGAPGSQIWNDLYYFSDDAAGTHPGAGYVGTAIITPIRGAWLRINYKTITAGGSSLKLNTTVVGRYLALSEPVVTCSNAYVGAFFPSFSPGNVEDNFFWMSGAKATGTTPIDYVPSQNGNCILTARNTANVTVLPLLIMIEDLQDSRILAAVSLPVGGTVNVESQPFIVSNRMLQVRIGSSTSVCSNFEFSLNFTPN